MSQFLYLFMRLFCDNLGKTNQFTILPKPADIRGYHWEDTIVKRFNASDGWTALRLGSPSTSLPDIMAVSTKYDTLYAIEAKSGTVGSLPVPIDQIERCKRINDIFDKYASRKIVLAFNIHYSTARLNQ